MFGGNYHDLDRVGRRGFLGGIGGLLAAASYSRDVSAADAQQPTNGTDGATQTLASPDESIAVTVDVADGAPSYSVEHEGTALLSDSALGFAFQNQPAFGDGLEVTGTERSVTDETWTPVWDRYDEIREHSRDLRIGLRETDDPGRNGVLELRAFDDGLAFRFVFDESFAPNSGNPFVITDERTEYGVAGDPTAWWIPNDWNNFEVEYERTAVSEIATELPDQFSGVHTPVTLRTDDDRYLALHEADLSDYASLALAPSEGETGLESELAPLPDGTKVSATAPHATPWRTIQVATEPGELVESSLHVNLNDDYEEDVFTQGVDWIEPQKFVGIWWLMITGRADWEYTGMESGNHGAQTGRAKQYMAFASEHGIPGVLIEGWNEGWSSYPGDGSALDFTEPYPDFDLAEVTDFGPSLDPPTQMTMHNETAGDFRNYEAQLDEAFALYDDLGIRTIKNGYVADEGDLAGEGYNHHNQVLVNHHTVVAETAAANRQMLDVHEPIHPSGRRREYPNLMTREGVKGQEYDAFGAVSPEHHVTIPFTRMLAGPMEYTPGIFDMDSGSGGIETTRAKQLAMYPTYFSGLQMVADLPSSYLAERPATLGVGELAQAEFGERDGFATAHRWANAQAEGYVPIDPNSVEAGSTVTWTVEDVPSDGEYDLHLRYASDAEENAVPEDAERTATVAVEGDSTRISFPPTDYWDVWETVTVPVSLSAGENEVAVALTEEDTGGLNLDAIAVTESGAPMPEPDPDHAPIRGPTVDAFQFIEDVPAADWDDTRVLDAAIGDYAVTARRHGEEWYLGAMTDEGGRAIDVDLSFLSPASERSQGRGNGRGNGNGNASGNGNANGNGRGNGTGNGNGRGNGNEGSNGNGSGIENGNGNANGRANGAENGDASGSGNQNGPKYVAEIYSDGIDAEYDENLTDVRIDEAIVTPDTTLLASMVGSGGTAVRFRPARGQDQQELPEYERPEQDVVVEIQPEAFVGEPFVSATGGNDGDYVGGTEIELYVGGELQRTENVRFAPNTDDGSFESTFDIDSPGEYDVEVRTADGEVLASQTVTIRPPETVATISDPSGDDYGPGNYVYPTNEDAFRDGAFDLASFEVSRTPETVRFTFEVETLYNAFGSDRGFSPQMFVCWIRDPERSGGATSSLDDLQATVDFEAPWQYRLEVSGFTKSAVDAGGAPLTDADGNAVQVRDGVDVDAGTVTLTVPADAFGDADPSELEVIAAVHSEDFGALRPVQPDAGGFVFGGADPDAVENAPRLMDVTTPDGVDQTDALAYDADSLATLPFVGLD